MAKWITLVFLLLRKEKGWEYVKPLIHEQWGCKGPSYIFNPTLSKGQLAEFYTIFDLESIFLQFSKSYF